jgi:DNA-binding MarR family transcriptional regulator
MSGAASAVRRRVKGAPAPEAATESERAALRVWLRLLTCTNLIERRVRTGLREQFGTTLPRFDVLAQLDAAESDTGRGLTMSELSERLMVTNGNLTGLVERLTQERLVTRSVSPNDGRTQIVRLTRAGKRSLDEMVPAHREWVERMFHSVSRSDRVALFDLLGVLRDSARTAAEDDDDE